MSHIHRIISVITFALISLGVSSGQSKSIGMTYSFNGFALSYEHDMDSSSFMDIMLKAECGDMFFGKARYPGITASFTWNMVFASKKSANGNLIRFHAGPGIIAGWCNDLMKPSGLVFGLKGRVGVECSFDRNITLSGSLCPVIGTHMLFMDGYADLRGYRMGILSAIMPEIGIRHSF